jgi:hypothetical protein
LRENIRKFDLLWNFHARRFKDVDQSGNGMCLWKILFLIKDKGKPPSMPFLPPVAR